MEKALPSIPAKRYFTIGEVSELCAVKPYVLRYWEQEFTQLKPMKRRGNRRYYQHHEVLLIRRIRELLYDHGFTISGARNRLSDGMPARASDAELGLEGMADEVEGLLDDDELALAHVQPNTAPVMTLPERAVAASAGHAAAAVGGIASASMAVHGMMDHLVEPGATEQLRAELMCIRDLLTT